ncbi:MAG: hypothetical protein WCO29_22455 [Nostocales cyanobacterium ELA583]|jgi:hypothetical protein
MTFDNVEYELNNIYWIKIVLKITMQVWTRNTKLQNGQYIIQKVIGGGSGSD